MAVRRVPVASGSTLLSGLCLMLGWASETLLLPSSLNCRPSGALRDPRAASSQEVSLLSSAILSKHSPGGAVESPVCTSALEGLAACVLLRGRAPLAVSLAFESSGCEFRERNQSHRAFAWPEELNNALQGFTLYRPSGQRTCFREEPACQWRRHQRCGSDPWVGKIPCSRARQPTPVLLPGEFHG